MASWGVFLWFWHYTMWSASIICTIGLGSLQEGRRLCLGRSSIILDLYRPPQL